MPASCFVPWARHDEPRRALVCFPWAGAGAAPFRTWCEGLLPGVDLWAVRLPGRENRLRERPLAGMDEMITHLLADFAALPAAPTIFFGHCSGALLAFELIRELRRRKLPQPEHFAVASSEAPRRLTAPRELREFHTELRALGITPGNVLASERVMRLLRPGIESDLQVSRSYVYKTEEILDMPISVFATAADYAANPAEFLDWRKETSGPVDIARLAAPNLYPDGAWDELGLRLQALVATATR